MIAFTWKRQQWSRKGIRWSLQRDGEEVGSCIYLSGSRRYAVHAGARTRDGVISFQYHAGTAASARQQLEREWCRRSIGLFGEDDIVFVEDRAA